MTDDRQPGKMQQAAGDAGPSAEIPGPVGAHENDPADVATFPIVGIGASAGGLAALDAFFSALPAGGDGDMAFVLVQHLSPTHKSTLVELVKRYTSMPVLEVTDGLVVQPNCIYIIPPGHDMTLVGRGLHLSPHASAEARPHLTVDHFFSSLAATQHERAICVVLSGTGSDGTLGLRQVKGEGGLVIAQSPETAEYDGMARNAIATGMVDYILPAGEIPARLMSYVRHAFDPSRAALARTLRESVLKKVCVLLRARTGHDFSQYKETALVRRMERRMALHQLARPEDYLHYARENPPEVDALFRDLLIGVTNFFRDPEAFQLLDEKVIARLVSQKSAHEPLRIWVCGCSTGEEAYSIAILLYEHMLAEKRMLKVQFFATDIDRAAIEQARGAVYPASIAAHVSKDRLARFFTLDPEQGTYRIQKHIRDLLVFSEQDVIKDPPFSKLDLLSCRNLLIYLNADLQRQLIPLFHYALVPGGALFLGTSETVGESARLFEVVDRKWKLYLRLPGEQGAQRPSLPDFVPPLYEAGERRRPPRGPADSADELGNLRQLTEKAMLAHYGAAGVLVDARGQILHIVGRTGQFLEPADGDASMNILAMSREGLRRELTVALHKAVAHKEPVSYPGLKVSTHGQDIRADMAVRPLELSSGLVLYLVILAETPVGEGPIQTPASGIDQMDRIAELERGLRANDEYLQTTLEEMETTNEELKSTNEEMQSVNEELQSTNEELETSKEELQSVNEELSTVNAELQDKVADLSRANNDMDNLLAGTGVGTVFVDHHLRIARFTPAATPVINFIAGDVGRPLEHVATNIVGYDRMVEDVRSVLESLVPKEAEVQVKGGAWYIMRIRPYRTMENLIEGAVITLVDISKRRKAEDALRSSEARLGLFINQAYAGVCETDFQGRFTFANDRLCDTLGYTREELLGKRLADLTDPQDMPRVQAELAALSGGGSAVQFEKCWVRRDGRRLRTLERVSVIPHANGHPASLLWLSFDLADGQERQAVQPRER